MKKLLIGTALVTALVAPAIFAAMNARPDMSHVAKKNTLSGERRIEIPTTKKNTLSGERRIEMRSEDRRVFPSATQSGTRIEKLREKMESGMTGSGRELPKPPKSLSGTTSGSGSNVVKCIKSIDMKSYMEHQLSLKQGFLAELKSLSGSGTTGSTLNTRIARKNLQIQYQADTKALMEKLSAAKKACGSR
jgi:hypothetical protein